MRFVALSLVVLAAILVALPTVMAQGQLTFEHTEYDFGTVEGVQEVTTTFIFTNTGDRPVRLTSVRPSCGCTTPYFTEGPLGAGERGEVQVGFNPQGRSGAFRLPIYLLAEVEGDDAVSETLFILGDVVPAAVRGGVFQGAARFDAEEFDAGTVSAQHSLTHRFSMQWKGDRPLEIERAHSFPEGANVVFPQLPVRQDDVVRIEVTLPPEMLAGEFDVWIALETNDREEPIKALRMIGTGE